MQGYALLSGIVNFCQLSLSESYILASKVQFTLTKPLPVSYCSTNSFKPFNESRNFLEDTLFLR